MPFEVRWVPTTYREIGGECREFPRYKEDIAADVLEVHKSIAQKGGHVVVQHEMQEVRGRELRDDSHRQIMIVAQVPDVAI